MAVYYFYDSSDPVPFNYLTPSRMAGELPPPYETTMSPNLYLEFAIADYAEGSQRGFVNAFGNVKRALHFSVDVLLNQYGLFTHFSKSNFPTKLQLLDDIGILPITIVKNLNVERNLVEHEYDNPPPNRVAEAIDVVKLLLLATEKLLESTPHEVIIGWNSPKHHVLLQLEPVIGELRLYIVHAKGQYKKINGISCLSGVRDFVGKLNPHIKLPKTPWKVITLNKTDSNEWKPIIRELVNIQRKNSVRQSVMDGAKAEVIIPITVPLPSLKIESWVKIIDKALGKKFEKDETTKSRTKKTANSASESTQSNSGSET